MASKRPPKGEARAPKKQAKKSASAESTPSTPETRTNAAGEEVAMPAMYVPAHGRGMLNAGGMPGNKGGGRKPDEFKRLMRRLACHPSAIRNLTNILKDPKNPNFIAAHKHVSDRGYDKPAQPIGGSTEPLRIVIVNEMGVERDA